MAHGTCLTGKTTTNHCAFHVHLAGAVHEVQGLLHEHAQHGTGEVGFDDLAIYSYLAGAALEPDAGNRVLAATGCVRTALGVDLWLGRGGGGNSRICCSSHAHGSTKV